MKKIFMAMMAVAAIALTSCKESKNTPDDPNNDPTPAQTEASVTAYYVTTAATLKYCDMAFTADGKEIKGTVKTFDESSMSQALRSNVLDVANFTSMPQGDLRVVEFAAMKQKLGQHKAKVVLTRNATALEEEEVNMARGWLFSSTDGVVSAEVHVSTHVGVDAAIGLDGEGENMLTLFNEAGEATYTLSAKK